MKKLGFFLLLIGIAFGACRKNTDVTTEDPNPFEPPFIENWVQQIVTVNGSVTGFVVDENGEPVKAASVKMGNETTTTDEFGHFFFKNTDLNARGTYIQIEKSGYFNGSRRFFAQADVENRVKVQLLEKNFSASFESTNGGTVETNGGATVKFSANSIRNADGTAYDGTVRVAAKWLNPSMVQTLDQMPGNLQGVNTLAEEVALETAGMMAVELETPTGEPLNILDGETAELSMPIPSNLVSSAPNEVPNWSFNEEHGMWVEEGVSTKIGNNYVGEVSHFTFWNCDFPNPTVLLSATFENVNGIPLYNYMVSLTTSWLCGYAYTGVTGGISGLVPQDETFLIEVHGYCGEVVYSETVGPFTEDTDLGVITIVDSNVNSTTVSGELVDCDGNAVENGVVAISFDGNTVYQYTEGEAFSVTFSSCDATSEVEVIGIDLDDLLQSEVITAAANVASDLEEISVCDQQLENYIRLNVDGVEVIYAPASISADSVFTYIEYFDQGSQVYFGFGIFGNQEGDYSGQNGHSIEVISDGGNNWDLGQGEFFETLEVTEFGLVGESVIGNFSGTMTNWGVQPAQEVEVTGDFNIIVQ